MSHRQRGISRRHLLSATATSAAALGLTGAFPAPSIIRRRSIDDDLRAAVIGTGRRGQDHLWALGYRDKDSELGQRKNLERIDPPLPGVQIVAVCDTYEANLEEGARQVRAIRGEVAKYVDYRELLDREDLDAVVIATPDHLHAPIAIAAAKKGCDVYVEKSITNQLDETFELERVLNDTGRILQAGFQAEQDFIHEQAKRIIEAGHIGHVHMVQTFLHRGGPEGAWVFPQEKDGGPPRDQIHWEEFLGPAPKVEYDPRRYFGWRRFWDYSTGISGDIFTHVLNSVANLVGVGIPDGVTASGGIYHWKEARETPDTFTVVSEFREAQLQVAFVSTLASAYRDQATRILGSDGFIELDWRLRVYADRTSERYAPEFRAGTKHANRPFIDITDSAAGMIVNSAPSQLWLGGRGATLTTKPDGQIRDTTRLQHENFFACVRSREQPASSFAKSLPATIAAHMATASFLEGRRIGWDPEKRRFV